jgi:predicted site-specific integrase-resolvase
MDAIEAGTVGTLIVAHKDRLTRLGYEWFERFCQRHACDILVLNQEHWSPEEELAQDLLAITQVFSARLYGLYVTTWSCNAPHGRKFFEHSRSAVHFDVIWLI